MKQRFIRVGDESNDNDVIVVARGGALDPVVRRAHALRNHSTYGTYGITVFAVRDLTLDGLALVPTGRNPPPLRRPVRRPQRRRFKARELRPRARDQPAL